MKYTICLDFDGVLHSYRSGYQGKPWIIPDPPVKGAIEWLVDFYLRSQLDDINAVAAIYSTRSKSLRGRRAMKKWLSYWVHEYYGISGFYIVQWVQWPWFKPPALVTVDDRAVRFEGDWADPSMRPEALLAQRPWFKK